MKAVTRVGDELEIDTSADACARFGFQHGDEIIVIAFSSKAVVVGVAPLTHAAGCLDRGEDVLWVRMDGEEAVCFFPNPESDFQKVQ